MVCHAKQAYETNITPQQNILSRKLVKLKYASEIYAQRKILLNSNHKNFWMN
jgi:hypothetical protein